ncbi:hypothetical protein CHARACLAT_011476 [Characodon lateralis]|uniref:Uncharacterized protein n=1 Tax=Characodon lateralis TaxID=208331 RepID=A0ABU7EI77_9TELE|nr:hypothetical protein [Characodon lateralis]
MEENQRKREERKREQHKSTCLLLTSANSTEEFAYRRRDREVGRSQPWGGTAAAAETSGLTVGIDSRKMLSWGEKGRESTERNRMEQGRVEQD